jgi:hypothetical protein
LTAIGTNVAAQQAVISLRSYFAPQGPTQQAILNSTTPDSFTADAAEVHTVSVPPSTTDQSFDLATLFPTMTAPVFCGIVDVSNPGIGFKITTVSGSGRVGVAPNFWWAYMGDGTTALPTVYISNASSTQTLYLSIGALGQ